MMPADGSGASDLENTCSWMVLSMLAERKHVAGFWHGARALCDCLLA